MPDPLDTLTDAGWRVAWANIEKVIVLRSELVVVADPQIERAEIARLVTRGRANA